MKRKASLTHKPPVKKARREVSFSEKDLECSVCWDMKLGPIFQCANSHFMCEDCHERVINSTKPCCPMCKEVLSITNPIRNRFAEKYLTTVETKCTNAGCKVKLQFGNLNHHLQHECKFRPWKCKYHSLGCSWVGVYHDRKSHKQKCWVRQLKIDKKKLRVLNARVIEEKAKERTRWQKIGERNQWVVNLLQTRARNIEHRHVMIQNRDDRMASGEFRAACSEWVAYVETITNPNDTKLGVRIEMTHYRRRQNLQIVILPGPQFGINFLPLIFAAKFSKRKPKSALFVLPISPEDAKRLSVSKEPINLRLIFVNRNSGIDSNFSSEMIDEEDLESSDMEEGSPFRNSDSHQRSTASLSLSPLYY